MRKGIGYFQNKKMDEKKDNNVRQCPECGMKSLKGMPGGMDATCKNCGYKDPCCYD